MCTEKDKESKKSKKKPEQEEKKQYERQQKRQQLQSDVTYEGYLKKLSLYSKQFKERYIILRENHLFCYTNDEKTKITELINLDCFTKSQLSKTNVSEFELLPKNVEDPIRKFSATMVEAVEWVNNINASINPYEIFEAKSSDDKGIKYPRKLVSPLFM